MEVEIKKAIKAGNSSAVILPRAWLNREVRIELVEKTPEMILRDVLDISKKYLLPEKIFGIYLVGSYARNEKGKDSDIDILIISEDVDKEIVDEGVYSILIVSLKLLKWKLENNLLPLGPMINEALPLINSVYLDIMKKDLSVTRKNVKWYIDTTKEKLDTIKEVIEHAKKTVDNRTAYTIVLRIRTLKLIQRLYHGKNYSKDELIRLLIKISGSNNAYESYLAIKDNVKKKDLTKKDEAGKLCKYLEKDLKNTEKLLKY